jgi:hypothetical protein
LDDDPSVQQRMVTIDPKDLIGRTFLKDSEVDGQRFRARVFRAVLDNEDNMKFICEVPNLKVNKMYTYNKILDHIEKDKDDIGNDTEQLYKFRRITAHQGPLRSSDKDYKGSRYNIFVEWETGETTYEPLDLIASDDPVTCAQYAKQHGLLDTEGWKRFRCITSEFPKVERLINQAKTSTYKHEPFWKFGYLVPQTHWQAMDIDKKNVNDFWKEAEATEMRQLLEYNTFVDKGTNCTPTPGYKKFRCHLVHSIKHYGRHRSPGSRCSSYRPQH